MEEIFKDCDNQCVEHFGRKDFVCSLYRNCSKFSVTQQQRLAIMTDDLRKRGYKPNEVISTIEVKLRRNLEDSERSLVFKFLAH
jgi:hypothetical protein